MNSQKIKDAAFRNKLACIYYPKAGVIEIKQKERVLRIQFPPDTPIQFSFRDSDDMGKPAVSPT